MNENILKKYAQLIVKIGVNISKDDELFISSAIDGADLAKHITEQAYLAGAKKVTVVYGDEAVARLKYTYEKEATLTDFSPWQVLQRNEIVDKKACYIGILSEDPEAFVGIDAQLLSNISSAKDKAFKKYYDAATSNKIRWCLCAVPCVAWAKKMFPHMSVDNAIVKLWECIIKTMRLDEKDSVQAWERHIDNLEKISSFMNTHDFVSLHYKNNIGTNFSVGLPDGYFFSGGNEKSIDGVSFTANMPTEEVFSLPDFRTAEGTVVASMPLIHNGNMIDKFSLKFKKGKIVDYYAEVGQDVLKGIIETDNGSHYLGEVALVQYDSPIRNMNTLFYNTLFDENASCHLAIGEAYPMIKGADKMSAKQLKASGVNKSATHVDFMIGTPDLSIIGVTRSGEKIEIFKNGNFNF